MEPLAPITLPIRFTATVVFIVLSIVIVGPLIYLQKYHGDDGE